MPQADAAGVRHPDPRATGSRTSSRTASRDLVINTHHRGDVIQRELGDGSALGARIQYSHEPTHPRHRRRPQARAAAARSRRPRRAVPLDQRQADLRPRLHRARRRRTARAGDILGMMVVRRVPDAKAWGAVDVRVDERGPHVDQHPRRRRAHVLRRPRHAAVGDGAPARRRVRLDPPGLPAVAARRRARRRVRARATATSPSTRRPSATSSRTGRCSTARTLRNPPGRYARHRSDGARSIRRATIVEPVRICAGARRRRRRHRRSATRSSATVRASSATSRARVVWARRDGERGQRGRTDRRP